MTPEILQFRADELRALRERAPADMRDDLARIESAIRPVKSRRPGDIRFARLIRDCPTPHPGGTCGCGCGCTSPKEAADEDELLRLQWEVSECRERLRGALANLEAFALDRRRAAP